MSEERNRRGRPKGTGIDDRGQLQRIAAMLASDPELKPTTAIKSLGVTDPSIIRRLRDKFHEARFDLMADVSGAASASAIASATSQPASAQPVARLPHRAAAETSPPRVLPARIGEPVRKAATPKAAAPAVKVAAAAPAAQPVEAPVATPAMSASAIAPMAIADPERAPAEAAAPTVAPKAAAPKSTTPRPAAPAAAPPSPVTATHTNVDPAAWLFTMCGFGILAASTALEAQLAWAQSLVRLPPMALALRQHIALNELAMTMVTPSATTRASFH